ncbi:MAG: bifunctional enoyl-CoA hydratase/phosphate acetyltransferase [Chitinophagaceae bacterium]
MTKKSHFDAILTKAKMVNKTKIAVMNPTNDVALMGAIEPYQEGFAEPILVGNKDIIHKVAKANHLNIDDFELVHIEGKDADVAQATAQLLASGKADVLMKGNIHTDDMMRAVVNKENGLRTTNLISHVFIMDVPAYHKLLIITDAAINIAPDLEAKAHIINNAVLMSKVLGVEVPKVAVLAAVEIVYAKMPNTVEAAALSKMIDRGQIKGCIIDGPLAFDNIISKDAAQIKGIHSSVCGDADIILAPQIETGNAIAKQLAYLAHSGIAGVVLGAKKPIVLTSRSDSAHSRLISAASAVLLADYQKNCKK